MSGLRDEVRLRLYEHLQRHLCRKGLQPIDDRIGLRNAQPALGQRLGDQVPAGIECAGKLSQLRSRPAISACAVRQPGSRRAGTVLSGHVVRRRQHRE